MVDEGDLLTSLSDNGGIFAYFNVSEPEYLNYQTHSAERENNQVSLIMANGETFPNKGIIQTIEGEFDNETGNIAFRAKFPNSNQLLRNGETGKIQMTLPLKNALIIPQKATYEIQDQKYVFVVDARGYVHARPIKIAFEKQNVYVVTEGLSINDKILVDGIQKVNDGDRISIRYKSPAEVMQSIKLKAN